MNLSAIVTTDILDERLKEMLQSIHSGMLAEMDTYYKSKSKAKVIPLAKTHDGKSYIRYPAVTLPVQDSLGGGFSMIQNYKKGDIVYLAPGMVSTANAVKGQTETDFTRIHSLENMVIIGSLQKQPSEHSPEMIQDGIVLYHQSGMKIILEENRMIFECSDSAEIKSGSSSLKVTASGTEISAGGSLQKTLLGDDWKSFMEDLLDLLTALTVTCTAPGSPSSPPINSSAILAMKARLASLLTSTLKVSA